MKAHRVHCSIRTAAVLFGLSLASGGGCATGGAANASGPGSTARGGDAEFRANFANVSLGDAVARAAADTVKALMNPGAGTVGSLTREDIITKAVDSGLSKAHEEGKTPTDEQKAELQAAVQKTVDGAQRSTVPDGAAK